MTVKRVQRKTPRTPQEEARIRAVREKFDREKPSMEQLLASGEYEGPVQAGAFWEVRRTMAALKAERERQQLTIAQLAELSGIDKAAISRLETGKQANPTVDTLSRIATALGVKLTMSLTHEDEEAPEQRERTSGKRKSDKGGVETHLAPGNVTSLVSAVQEIQNLASTLGKRTGALFRALEKRDVVLIEAKQREN